MIPAPIVLTGAVLSLLACKDIAADKDKFDALIVVSPDIPKGTNISSVLQKLATVDTALTKEGCATICDEVPGNRLVYAPTGSVDGDYDDVRLFAEAAKKRVQRS